MAEPALTVPALDTVEAFLDWAEAQEGRFEFVDGRVRTMTAAHPRHSAITANVVSELRRNLRGGPCRPFGPDFGVRTTGTRVRSPDVSVVCGTVRGRTTSEPVVVVEVLSPSTEREDYGPKRLEYLALPALRHYVILAQDAMRAEVWTRRDDGWHNVRLDGPAAEIALTAVGCILPLAEVYADLPPVGDDG